MRYLKRAEVWQPMGILWNAHTTTKTAIVMSIITTNGGRGTERRRCMLRSPAPILRKTYSLNMGDGYQYCRFSLTRRTAFAQFANSMKLAVGTNFATSRLSKRGSNTGLCPIVAPSYRFHWGFTAASIVSRWAFLKIITTKIPKSWIKSKIVLIHWKLYSSTEKHTDELFLWYTLLSQSSQIRILKKKRTRIFSGFWKYLPSIGPNLAEQMFISCIFFLDSFFIIIFRGVVI